jgi:hypothetical protein
MRIHSVYFPINILLVRIITFVAATLHLQNLTLDFNSPPDYMNSYLMMMI